MKLSEAEWQIMNALWKKYPATAREIIGQMETDNGWAYTTVKTMLTRLAAKGVVGEEKRGNTSWYMPLVDQSSARKSALETVFDRVLDGTVAPLMNFLIEERKLSRKEREELIRMLRESERKGKKT
ncbi:BlaI/MecI/CopY family transcriptional regulator [bacterium]|nr:BlaI/MecI/CopY family transcriptional regulator [bacterium]